EPGSATRGTRRNRSDCLLGRNISQDSRYFKLLAVTENLQFRCIAWNTPRNLQAEVAAVSNLASVEREHDVSRLQARLFSRTLLGHVPDQRSSRFPLKMDSLRDFRGYS